MSVTLNQPRASLIHISPEPQKFENTGLPQNLLGFVGRGNAAKQAIEFIAYKFGASTACVDDGAVHNRPSPKRKVLIMPFVKTLLNIQIPKR